MLISTIEHYNDVVNQMRQHLLNTPESRIGVDVETNGLDPFKHNQLCGVGIACNGNTYYFPFRHQQGANLPSRCLPELMDCLRLAKTVIGYNIKFDLKFLEKEGYNVGYGEEPFPEYPVLADVIVMMRLVEPAEIKELGLTKTITRVFGEEYAAYDNLTKKTLRSNKWQKDFSLAPPELLGPYCEQDVYWTEQLYDHSLKIINESGQADILKLEQELTRVLYAMENVGVSIDLKYLGKAIDRIDVRKVEVENQIYELAGKEFNISSTQQVGEVLNEQGIYSPIKTNKGQDSWSEAALVQLDSQLAALIRQYRALGKLKSTYLEPYLDTPVMHTSFCNWGAVTGRLSSREPNLQNIPRTHFKLLDRSLTEEERDVVRGRINAIIAAKGTVGELSLSDPVLDTWGFVGDESFNEEDDSQLAIRRLFIPREGYSLVSFDYSQMEVRVFLSYLHNDEVNLLLQRDDIDFHGEAAKIAFHVDEGDDEYKFYRQMAKNITFGVIYGIGKARLANQLNVSEREALQYKKKYFAGMQGAKLFIDKVARTVENRGWVKNMYGRIYKIPSDFSYKGVNYLVQGTSADMLNERMVEVHEYLKNKRSNLVLQVHDEIICEIHNEELDEVSSRIRELMEVNSLNIPLKVDVEICKTSWATKKDFEIKEPVAVATLEDYIDWG